MSLRRASIQRAAFQRVGYDESFLLIRQGSELTVSVRASLRMKTRGYLRTAVDINKIRMSVQSADVGSHSMFHPPNNLICS